MEEWKASRREMIPHTYPSNNLIIRVHLSSKSYIATSVLVFVPARNNHKR